MALVALALAVGPRSTDAAVPAPGAVGTPTLLARDEAPSDAKATKRSARGDGKKEGAFQAPGWVMMRSLVVPGWGQLHNRAWLKAIGVATGEIWMGMRLLDDRDTLTRIEDEVDRIENEVSSLPPDDPRLSALVDRRNDLVEDYNGRLDGYTARQWLLGALVAYALLDAYVDAHFRGFDIEFDADPALEGAAEPRLRVAIRGTF